MKKIAIFFIITIMFVITSFSQKNIINKESKIGIHFGENTGFSVSKNLTNLFYIQYDIGINELFLNYNFINKYTSFCSYQSYEHIFSSSINIKFKHKLTKDSLLFYNISLGPEIRLIPHYSYIPQASNNEIIIDDPITTTKINFGVNYFIGFDYSINKRCNIFIDVGGYSELYDLIMWSNFQFKIGVEYVIYTK